MIERVVQIFRSFGLTRGGLRSSRVRAFAAAAAEGYRPNPYHNFYHGFHVLHATQLMLRSSAVRVSCPCLLTITTSVTVILLAMRSAVMLADQWQWYSAMLLFPA
jgi:hypothetical protein